MVDRRRTKFSAEGWYFLFVLSFIMGGAVLREVNLLILLAGLMVGLLLFNWRFSSAMIRRLVVRRGIPRRVCAGEVFSVDVVVKNDRRWLAGWAIAIEDRIQQQQPAGQSSKARARTVVSFLPARGSARTSYRCCIGQRGVYQFGPLEVSSRFPLGFVQTARNFDQYVDLTVYPRMGRLSTEWAKLLESATVGDQQAHVDRGMTEGDYYGLRDWRAGDNQRWIHWRASAKLQELKVREFEQRSSRKLTLLLDLWQPAKPTDEDLERIESILSFAATTMAAACQQGGYHISFKSFGTSNYQRSGNASAALRQDVLDYLAIVQGTTTERELYQALGGAAPDSRTVVLSTRSREQVVSQFVAARDGGAHGANGVEPRWVRRLSNITWIQAGSPEQSLYFELDSSSPEQMSRENRAVVAN